MKIFDIIPLIKCKGRVVANIIGALSTSIKAVSEGISSGVSSVMTKTSAIIHDVADRLFPECAICYDGRVYIPSPLPYCSHKFHSKCLSDWAQTQRRPKCPYDQTRLNVDGARNRSLKLILVGALVASAASICAYNQPTVSKDVDLGYSSSYPMILLRNLEHACEEGHLDEINTIIKNPLFSDWRNYGIGHCLENAAENGHSDIINDLITNQRFADTPWIYIKSLEQAANNGHLDIVNILIENPQFDDSGIRELFVSSCFTGNLNVLNVLLASPRFAAVDIDTFKTGFQHAINRVHEANYWDVRNAVTASPRYAEAFSTL